ncbi:ferredoxin [Streptomyces sp. NPDC019443]|uniref:ferredoxin n=1 Tax=Streptomyces sp. NPDC019443 TaxID=3365061 RepID=UPI0037893254
MTEERDGLHVTVKPDVCIGAGQCVLAAPEVFDQDDDGVVQLVDEAPEHELHRDVRLAAARCPVEAIGVVEP